MTQRTVIIIEDDIDGTQDAKPVRFALDGTTYEIDLTEQNAASLRAALEPFIGAARRTTRKTSGRVSEKRGGDNRASQIREWARENGHDVPKRGRIPARIREAYEAA